MAWNIQDEVESFLRFMEKHKNEDMLYEGESGLLYTRNCDGYLKSGCCSEQFDLESLCEKLKELTE